MRTVATNYVALKITATDEAKPDLTELQARLDELKDRVATARAEVDDAQADAALADLDAKLDMASKKVASPKIDIAGASRAAAQVTAVEAELDGLDARASESAAKAAAAEVAAAQEAAAGEIAAAQEAAAAEAAAAREAAAAQEAAAREAAAAQEAAAEKAAEAQEAAAEKAAAAGEKMKLALVGVAIGAGLAVKGAMDFQAQTTRLVTSAGETSGNLGMVRQGMLAISAQTATSTAEMAKGMYTVESAGFHGAQGLKVLKAAAQGAKDEGADLATVSNAVTDVLVDFHMKASQSATATSELVKAVSFGKTTFEEFSGSMSNVLPLASAMHLKLADVTGVLAEMTAHGMSAQQASQDEANAMRELMKPNAAMVKEFKALGISSDEVYRKLGSAGLGGTMQWLSGVAQKGSGAIGQNYTQALGKLMGTAPGLSAALMTTGQNAADTNKAIKGIAGASADAKGNVDGFSKVSETLAFKMSAAKESMAAAGTSLGQVLLPAVTAIMGPASRMLQLIASNKAASVAFAVVIGGVLAGAIGGKLAKSLKDMEEGIKSAGDKIGWLVGKLTGQKTAEEAAAAAAKKSAVEQAAAAGEGAAAQETAAAEGAGAQEAAAAESSASWVSSAATTIGAWASAAASGIASAASWVAAQAVKVASVVASNVAGAAMTAAAWIASAASGVASAASWVAGAVLKVGLMVAANVAGAVATAAAWVIANGVMLLGIGLVIAVVVAAVVMIVKHWRQISDAAKEAFDAVVHAVSVAIDWVKAHWPLLLGILLGPIALAAALVWTFRKQVMAAIGDAIDWVKGHWPLLLAILTGPIGLAVLFIVDHWRQIVSGAEDAFHAVTRAVSTAIDWVRSHWPLILAIIVGPIGIATLFVVDHWRQIVSGAKSMVHDVVSFFTGLGHDVISIVDKLAGDLFGAGARVVQFLANGIKSAVGQVTGAISNVVSEVKSFLPFSPAKKGPLSGAGSPDRSGLSIARMLGQGLTAGLPDVTSAMSRLTGGVRAGRPGTGGGYGTGGNGGPQEFRFVFETSDSKIMTAFMGQVRVMGGDPQMFTRKVAYR